jgi:hypothetical protein
VLRPDPHPPAIVAHVTVAYSVVLRDRLGRRWRCFYPVTGPRRCLGERLLLQLERE